ncbi:tripartite tricarboxylate transporter permease [Sulfitobacter sp. AS92]|uniref:tripartite tricarboxylate transporter permease n=1 Tax=Sulfitobacter sp. AS92 TaxID=3135783 RepID=UPI0031710B25
MENFVTSFAAIFTPLPFLFLFIGVSVGIIVGAIPGLTGGMVIALALPLTFLMDGTHALIMLVAMYVGSTSGGLISATLMRMPGTPAAMMTTLDAYPMAREGRPGRALGLGIFASFGGGLISWVFLAGLSPTLSELAVQFGPYEIFAMALLALLLISAIGGGSLSKSLLSGSFGILVSLVGVDKASGSVRLTFGNHDLDGGFRLLAVILGMLVLSQVLSDVTARDGIVQKTKSSTRDMWISMRDLMAHRWNLIRSSLIGTWIGVLPGIGGSTAAIASYSAALSLSETPEEFGSGSEEGIVAAEAANNAAVNGALVPLITLGIPGSVVDVLLLGALVIQGLTPGPLLFVENPEVAYGIISSALVANIVMFAFMLVGTPYISKLMYVNKKYLLPAIIVFCVIGAFSQSNRMFDVWTMFAFGLIGFLMMKTKIPHGPFVIGFVLAPIAELNLRSGLQLYDGSFMPLITRPIPLLFIAISVIALFWPLVKILRAKRKIGA